jgi:hypothetical protein
MVLMINTIMKQKPKSKRKIREKCGMINRIVGCLKKKKNYTCTYTHAHIAS